MSHSVRWWTLGERDLNLHSSYTLIYATYRRVAQAGRNWEGFGADPYLAGEAAYETILGMQQGGVQACAKHFVNKYAIYWDKFTQQLTVTRNSDQEHKRTMSSSNVDDRTQHELYALPFLRSVQAGVASVMCSYSEYPVQDHLNNVLNLL